MTLAAHYLPIEKADANTQETFGGYVSIYDIEDAKEDKATVPIYYKSRLAKLDINREEIDALDKDVVEVIEDEEEREHGTSNIEHRREEDRKPKR